MAFFPKLGILAGGGSAPRELADACKALDRPFIFICLEGHADPSLPADDPHIWLPLGGIAKLRDFCAQEQIAEIVMIGRVRRPSITELKPDWLTLKILTKIGINSVGDDGLLRGVGKAIEEECGVRVIGAGDVFAGLMPQVGVLTQKTPSPEDEQDIAKAIEIAQEMGRLDIGQAVIVQHGLVLGVEAIEGTDALIARAAELRREGGGGVLVKIAKPQQDRRFDLPAIGPDSVAAVARAGLSGIALHAGHSLLLQRDKTIEAANMAGIFIYAFEHEAKNG